MSHNDVYVSPLCLFVTNLWTYSSF